MTRLNEWLKNASFKERMMYNIEMGAHHKFKSKFGYLTGNFHPSRRRFTPIGKIIWVPTIGQGYWS